MYRMYTGTLRAHRFGGNQLLSGPRKCRCKLSLVLELSSGSLEPVNGNSRQCIGLYIQSQSVRTIIQYRINVNIAATELLQIIDFFVGVVGLFVTWNSQCCFIRLRIVTA